MHEKTECILCGNVAFLKTSDLNGYQLPLKFNVFHCSACESAFNLPRVPSSEIYNNIYNNVERIPGYKRYWSYFKSIKLHKDPFSFLANSESTYWGVQKALSDLVKDKNNTKILEVGSGMGYLTYSLKKDGYNILGLDISQSAVNRAVESFGEFYICSDVYNYSETNKYEYDIIILTEVIEHVDDPLKFLKSLEALLKIGGHIVLTTPNKSIYPEKTIWASDLPPVHLWWFSERSLEYIANRLDLTISFIDFSDFYKKYYQSIRPSEYEDMNNLKPYLDEHGQFLEQKQNKSSVIRSIIKDIASRLPLIRSFVLKVSDFYIPSLIVCSSKGTIICSIMTKIR